MIVGRVSIRHAIVPLRVRGAAGEGDAEFFLDTGFAGFMTLPPDAVHKLNLIYMGPRRVSLAEGSRVLLDVYRLTVLWDGVEGDIEVLEMNGAPLIGMSLLDGYAVYLQAVEGGRVSIERL